MNKCFEFSHSILLEGWIVSSYSVLPAMSLFAAHCLYFLEAGVHTGSGSAGDLEQGILGNLVVTEFPANFKSREGFGHRITMKILASFFHFLLLV